MPTMHSAYQYMTADTVAETVEYGQYLTKEESRELYRKLWGFLTDAKK